MPELFALIPGAVVIHRHRLGVGDHSAVDARVLSNFSLLTTGRAPRKVVSYAGCRSTPNGDLCADNLILSPVDNRCSPGLSNTVHRPAGMSQLNDRGHWLLSARGLDSKQPGYISQGELVNVRRRGPPCEFPRLRQPKRVRTVGSREGRYPRKLVPASR